MACPLSDRHGADLRQERGLAVAHSASNRWALTAAGGPWGCAVDNMAQAIARLMTEPWAEQAATRVLTKAIRRPGVPETSTIDGSKANAAAIREDNEAYGTTITIRQVQYLNNVGEQDHRAVKRVTRPTTGFKSFAAAQETLAGIEFMHMLKKGQMVVEEGTEGLTPAEQFYSLAA